MNRLPCFLLLLLLGACGLTGPCRDTILETKPDLDGALIAYRYVRDCGATTGYATHIAIGRRDERRRQATIVFIADGDEFGSGTGGDGARSEMRWIAPRQLSITYSEKARLFRREPMALEARVTYRPDR